MTDTGETTDRPGAGLALGKIREARQKIAARKDLLLVVPGYDNLVAVRYQTLSPAELDIITTRIQKANEKGDLMAANADLLIRSCKEIVGRTDASGEWEPVLGEGTTTTFASGTLAEALGEQASTSREEVYALFSPGGQQPMAHATHAAALSSWMNGQVEAIEAELLGE